MTNGITLVRGATGTTGWRRTPAAAFAHRLAEMVVLMERGRIAATTDDLATVLVREPGPSRTTSRGPQRQEPGGPS